MLTESKVIVLEMLHEGESHVSTDICSTNADVCYSLEDAARTYAQRVSSR